MYFGLGRVPTVAVDALAASEELEALRKSNFLIASVGVSEGDAVVDLRLEAAQVEHWMLVDVLLFTKNVANTKLKRLELIAHLQHRQVLTLQLRLSILIDSFGVEQELAEALQFIFQGSQAHLSHATSDILEVIVLLHVGLVAAATLLRLKPHLLLQIEHGSEHDGEVLEDGQHEPHKTPLSILMYLILVQYG